MMDSNYIQLPYTVMVEMLTLALLSFIALSPLGMFVWMAIHPERYPGVDEPMKHSRRHHRRAHLAH